MIHSSKANSFETHLKRAMSAIIAVALCFIVTLTEAQPTILSTDQFCLENSAILNGQDFYGDPNDCHFFFQCFYDGNATGGIRQPCPQNQFWSQKLLTCVPESSSQKCQDPCYDSANSTDSNRQRLDCYAADQCSSYFMCANTASYAMCCPEGTTFVTQTCSCELDVTCVDKCKFSGISPTDTTTSTAGPQIVNAELGVCRDSYGNYLAINQDDPKSYWIYQYPQNMNVSLLVFGERSRVAAGCPQGTAFDVAFCECRSAPDESSTAPTSSCIFYAPYDEDLNDHSTSKFIGYPYGEPLPRVQSEVKQNGAGSLELQGTATLQYPGLKTMSFASSASWCFFYSCPTNGCTGDGAIVATSNSIKAIHRANGTLEIELTFFNPWSKILLSGNPPNGAADFVQVCVVYNTTAASLFLNRTLVDLKAPSQNGASVEIGHLPYVVGHDPTVGFFSGFFDEFLVCPLALNGAQIEAHRRGAFALAAFGLVPQATKFCAFAAWPETGWDENPSQLNYPAPIRLFNDRIIGGTPVGQGVYPWMVSITILPDPFSRVGFQCGGALLNKNWVITGAHCVYGNEGFPKLFPGSIIELKLGASNLQKEESGTEMRGYSLVLRHCGYSLVSNSWPFAPFDFALIRLDSPVTFSETIQPIRLPSELKLCDAQVPNEAATFDGCTDGYVTVAGWGYINGFNRTTSPVLLEAELKLISRSNCENYYEDIFDAQLCAIDRNETATTCQGDSGGPLVCTQSLPTKPYMMGLLSFGKLNCPANQPTVYARVCEVSQWITDAMAYFATAVF